MEEELVATSCEESKHRKALRRYKSLDFTEEPLVKTEDSNDPEVIENRFIKAFNYYSSRYDRDKAKSFIVAYVKNTLSDKDTIESISACNEFKKTAAWIARIASRGTNLPEKYSEYLNKALKQMEEFGQKNLTEYRSRLEKLSAGREKAQQKFEQHVENLTNECIGELEHQLDVFLGNKFANTFDVRKFLKDKRICKDQCSEISNHFQKSHLNEIDVAVSKKDAFLVEAYSNYSDKELKALQKYISDMIATCNKWLEEAPEKVKQERKPRKRKAKTPQQLVKKLKYLSESKEFNLQSVPPEKIVGANQVWVFNVKYRNLGVYNSADSAGLSLKGSTLKNFDEDSSVEKKLRKPKEILKGVLEGGKPAVRKSLQNINCKERKLTGRINKDVIILRVF